MIYNLGKSSKVGVLNDKPNSFKIFETKDYTSQVMKHLNKSAIEIPRSNLIKISEIAEELLDKVDHILNEKGNKYIKEIIESKAIPTPKL